MVHDTAFDDYILVCTVYFIEFSVHQNYIESSAVHMCIQCQATCPDRMNKLTMCDYIKSTYLPFIIYFLN